MRRLAVLIAAAAAAVAAIAALAGNGNASHPGSRTIVLQELDRGSVFKFIDHPPRSRGRGERATISTGDQFAFRTPVQNQAGQRAGALHALCTATRGGRNFGRATFMCDGSYRLTDGQIALQVVFSGEGPTVVAVTGGTGAYEGARGSCTSTHTRIGDRDTCHIVTF